MNIKQKIGGGIGVSIGAFLLVTSAFYPLSFLSPFDAKRILQLFLFIVIMAIVVFYRPLREQTAAQLNRLSNTSRVALALFFLIGIASSFQLQKPGYALVDVSMLFVMVVMVAAIAASRDLAGKFFDKWVVVLLSALGFAVFLQEFMGYVVGWLTGLEFSYDRALIHFGHPRFYNTLQTLSIPIVAALPLFFPTRKSIKYICIALLGLQWFIVIATGARGTTASLLVAMVLIGLWLPAARKYWLRFQVLGLLFGIATYFIIVMLNSAFIPASKSGEFLSYSTERTMLHTSGRTKFWKASVKDAISNPLLGSGPSTFGCSNTRFPAHPHSFLFRILGEWGFIAAFLLLVIAFPMGLKFLKNLKYQKDEMEPDAPLEAMLAISLIAGVVHSCLSGVMTMPASQTTIVLIGGWVLSITRRNDLSPRTPRLTASMLILGFSLAVAQFSFGAVAISQSLNSNVDTVRDGVMTPRFWQENQACGYSKPEVKQNHDK